MLIAAIALIILVVGGVGTMSVVMQEHTEIVDAGVEIDSHSSERVQEEVEVTRDSTGLQLYNTGPEVKILEYRVLDDGALVRSCPALLEVGSTQKETIGGTEPALKDCWDEYDDPDERFQIVTSRGKIFTLSESGSGNSTTTIIIDNSTHTVINNTLTGGGVGFGFLPQIEVYEPPIKMIAWGNSTHTDASPAIGFHRVGEVDHTVMVRANDEPISFTLPPFSGEYRLSGGKMVAANDLSVHGSDWEDKGGWLEMSGGKNGTEPYTSVVRLQDYSLDRMLNITAYASENATIKIVSSPNDLTRLAPAGDGLAPEVVPFDSYLNYTKVLVNSYASSYSTPRTITHDLFECVPGRTDSDLTRGYRCHEYAYPSYPATVYTDFYAKQCGGVVETHRVNIGTPYSSNYVSRLLGVESGYTQGQYNSTGVYPQDFERRVSTTLTTLPEIECGPKIEGYRHVTKIEQNQTHTYGDTHLFGPDQGTQSSGDLLQEIHGNVTLTTGDHDVLFEGTGTFEEVADLRRSTTTISKVTVEAELARSPYYGSLILEAPDGQQYQLCSGSCGYGSPPTIVYYPEYKVMTRTVSFNTMDTAGDWTLHGARYDPYHHRPNIGINSWALSFGHAGIENIFDSPYYMRTSSYTPIDTITVPQGPQLKYRGDLYLMAVGVNATETVMLRSTDYVSPSLLSISNLPPYVPYEITHGNFTLKTGMTDNSGRIEIQHSEVGIELTEPITLKYWPNSLTYVGNHHANGKSIMFDTYHDRVIPFPWDPNDPLLYIAKAYVRAAIPVDGMSLDAIRLYNKAGQYVSYSYLTGTYDAGDEVFIPVFLGAN